LKVKEDENTSSIQMEALEKGKIIAKREGKGERVGNYPGGLA